MPARFLTTVLAPVLTAAFVLPAAGATAQAPPAPDAAEPARTGADAAEARIVCVGAALTETAFALGAGPSVVAVDSGSTTPTEAQALPQLGYHRALSAEGVLARRPSLVLVTTDAGPPAALQQLRDAGAVVVVLPVEHSVEGAVALIRGAAAALGRVTQGEALVDDLRRDVARAEALLAQRRDAARAALPTPRVLCLYARSRGTLHVCCEGTALDAMIRLAGARNALQGLLGSKPLGDEAAVAAAPDILLLPAGSVTLCGGIDAVLDSAGLALTPAGRERRVVIMEDQLLAGFGPRTGLALLQLVDALHAPSTAAQPGATPPRTGTAPR